MRGGRFGSTKATSYIERELRRLGLTPGGDNGTFFQDIGYRTVVADTRSTLTVDDQALTLGRDYAPVVRVGARAELNMDMVGRGRASDHAGGGPQCLRLIGSRRLSTELGDIVKRVNTDGHDG